MRGSGKAWLWMAFGALGCGEEPDDFARPTAVAFSPSGDIYVADGYDHGRIVRFDSDGCWLGSFGERGLGRGQFEVPHGIAIDADGRVYVADRDNARVQVFEVDGRFVAAWHSPELGHPWAVAIGPSGHVYVADGGNQTPGGAPRRIVELDTEGMGDAEYEVLLYEFKADLNDYLASSNAPLGSLAEIIAFNEAHAATVMPFFGQEIMELAQTKGPLTDAAYLEALEKSKRIAREAIDGALAEHDLDAFVAPTNGPAWLTDHILGDRFSVSSSSLAAVSGYAAVTVPAGYVSGLPVGVSFIGGPFSEAALIGMAYDFEQASQARRPPLADGR